MWLPVGDLVNFSDSGSKKCTVCVSSGIIAVLIHTPHPTRHVGPLGYVGPSGLPGYRAAYVNYPAYSTA